FSLIPLQQYSSLRIESFKSIFTAIQKFLGYERSAESFLQKKKVIVRWLEHDHAKTQRSIAAVEKELSESSRSEQYERFGKLLMGNLHAVTKGMKSIDVEDHFSGNEMITIPLDASASPVHNAERYFEKAKKAKIQRQESESRLDVLHRRFTTAAAAMEASQEITDSISLKNFLHSNNRQLTQLGFMTEKEKEQLPPFKIFTVDGGFTVYAGKSSENNDLLTVKYSKPNDLWFHARGSSGSHVVLKIGSGQGTPSKKAIEQTAAIAAYYSKMKNAKHVPVAMTEKKYVRKPKGVPTGTVVIEKEKVIFIQPKLPHENR
ncbi:MAG: NFACT RNA binding domain-containing protein, partial [Bacteroidota bacterium]|nr:NFACT RNA binding domain-containing protein [Bacteroidota bacterium]